MNMIFYFVIKCKKIVKIKIHYIVLACHYPLVNQRAEKGLWIVKVADPKVRLQA